MDWDGLIIVLEICRVHRHFIRITKQGSNFLKGQTFGLWICIVYPEAANHGAAYEEEIEFPANVLERRGTNFGVNLFSYLMVNLGGKGPICKRQPTSVVHVVMAKVML
jgi:hypothetical protein